MRAGSLAQMFVFVDWIYVWKGAFPSPLLAKSSTWSRATWRVFVTGKKAIMYHCRSPYHWSVFCAQFCWGWETVQSWSLFRSFNSRSYRRFWCAVSVDILPYGTTDNSLLTCNCWQNLILFRLLLELEFRNNEFSCGDRLRNCIPHELTITIIKIKRVWWVFMAIDQNSEIPRSHYISISIRRRWLD